MAGLPTLRIHSVAGVEAPAEPTGSADIALPADTINPVDVVVATSGVPLGNTVTVRVVPGFGNATDFISNALSGATEAGTAQASVVLPPGPSTLLAMVSYDVPAEVAMAEPLRSLSGADDLITRIAMEAGPGGALRRVATTRSGRSIELDGAFPILRQDDA